MTDREVRSGEDSAVQKQAEQALRESEERYRTMLGNLPGFVYRCENDRNWTMSFISDGCRDVTGYAPEDFLHNKKLAFNDIIRPDYQERAWLYVQDCLRQKKPFQHEYPIVVASGETDHWVWERGRGIFADSGQLLYIEGFITDITERKRAEEETQRERAFFDRLVETAPEGIAIADSQGRITRVNTEFVRMFGYEVDEAVGRDIDDLVVPPVREEEARAMTGSASRGDTSSLETVRRRKDGTLVDVSIIAAPILIAGKLEAVYAIYRDITERKQMEDKLRLAQLQWDQFLETSPDEMWIKDASGRYVAANKTFRMVDPSKDGNIIGKTDAECFSPERAAAYVADDQIAIEKGVSEGEFTAVGVDGKLRYFLTKKVVLRTPTGEVAGTLGVSRDITERKQMEQKLEEMATHDFLTGLPNRVLLIDRFNIAAALAHRNKAKLAIMSLDLDKFKSINDTFGHDVGDQVLKIIGRRLTRIMRASDTFARVGGDEFISVMMETSHLEDATAVAQKILDSFAEPISVGGHRLLLSTSIGIAVYPDDGEDLETLTQKSDAAMYYSKGHGGNRFTFYKDTPAG